jgi:hypothetical protein
MSMLPKLTTSPQLLGHMNTKSSFALNTRVTPQTGLYTTYVRICECMYKKRPLQINFIYLHNKKFYSIFKIYCIISVLFSTKCRLFHNFIFFCSNRTFFTNHTLKFKYQPDHLNLKITMFFEVIIQQRNNYYEHLSNSCR